MKDDVNNSTIDNKSNLTVILNKFKKFLLPKERGIYLVLISAQIISCFFTWIVNNSCDYKYKLYDLSLEMRRGWLFWVLLILPFILCVVRFFIKTTEISKAFYIANIVISIATFVLVNIYSLIDFELSAGIGMISYIRFDILNIVLSLIILLMKKR